MQILPLRSISAAACREWGVEDEGIPLLFSRFPSDHILHLSLHLPSLPPSLPTQISADELLKEVGVDLRPDGGLDTGVHELLEGHPKVTREGEREGGRERGREGGREGGKEGGRGG